MTSAKPKVAFGLGVAAGLVAMFLLQQRTVERLRQENWELRQGTNLQVRSSSEYGSAASAQSDAPVPVSAATTAKRPSWREVESEDYREYISNMREMKIPDETIRDIVLADINKLYASRKSEVLKGTVRDEFWKPGGRGQFVDSDRLDALRELSTEKETVIKELLGLDIPQRDFTQASNDLESEMESKWPFLSEEKRAAVTQVTRAAHRNIPKSGLTSDEARNWREKYDESLRQALSTEEFEEYQLRDSGVSSRLRDQLLDFQPNEHEFRQLFGLVKDFGGSMETGYSQEQWKEVKLNDKKMFESESFRANANRILGPSRARELFEKVKLD
jgi:hypothetical protein